MNVEVQLISKLLTEKDWETVDKFQIKSSLFNGKYKKYFTFVKEFVAKYGKTPSFEEFTKRFPDFTPSESEEPLAYFCDELRIKKKHNTIAQSLEEMKEKLNEFETEEAYSIMKKTVLEVENEIILGDTKKLNEDTERRWEKYLQRAEMGGITGLPTDIVPFDTVTGGLGMTDLVTILGYTNIGKANPLSTPILTPDGFIPMREVAIGTRIIGEDGKPHSVTQIYPQGIIDVYEVEFNDGTTSRCSKEHLWKFKAKSSKHKEWQVDTLGNIQDKYNLKLGKSWNLSIPVCKPVEFAPQQISLPLDPYVLGVLLGDGGFTTDRISFTNPEEDLLEVLQNSLSSWGEFVFHKGTSCSYVFKSVDQRENKLYRVIKALELTNHRSERKFIPKDYLQSSIENRESLLKGLMDTDGSVSNKGTYQFFTVSSTLKDDFVFLCHSLGYRSRVHIDRQEGIRDGYRITIFTKDIIVSSRKHLERLSKVQKGNRDFSYDELRITNIQLIGKEECQCISVDSKDHTYLCDDFIVTHNTWLLIILGVNLAKSGKKVLFVTREMSPEQVEKRVDAVWADISYTDFNKGRLTPEDEVKYKEYLKGLEGNSNANFVIELSTGGVSNVSALVDKHKPDVLFIDGGYLLTGDSDEGDWTGIVETWRGFKAIALNRKVPVVVTMQLKANKATLDNIALAKYIAQDCDVIFGMEQDEVMKNDKECRFKPLKLRDSDTFATFVLNWDFNKMNYSPQYIQGDVPAKGLVKTLEKKKEKVTVVKEEDIPKDVKKVKLVKVGKKTA